MNNTVPILITSMFLAACTLSAAGALAQSAAPVDRTPPTSPPVIELKPRNLDASVLKLSAAEANALQGHAVYSNDNKKVGSVVRFVRAPDGTVAELLMGIGGFLAIGAANVRILPTEFELAGDIVTLRMTAAQAKALLVDD